jgi:hypothetical protein
MLGTLRLYNQRVIYAQNPTIALKQYLNPINYQPILMLLNKSTSSAIAVEANLV